MHPFFGVCSGDENVTCVHAHAFQTGISTHKMQISRLVFQVCKSFLPLCYAYEGGKEHIKSSLLTRLSLMSCFLSFFAAPPKILYQGHAPNVVTTSVGVAKAVLECEARGDRPITVTWTKVWPRLHTHFYF